MNTLSLEQSPAVLDALPRLPFEENSRVKEAKAPQFLLIGMGEQIEKIAVSFAASVRAANVPGMSLGLAAEVAQVLGQFRAIRVLQTDREVHKATTDVVLRRQADDLYVQFKVAGRSWLKYLKVVVYGTIGLVLWCFIYGMFYSMTNTQGALIQSYTRQWSDGNYGDIREARSKGFVYDESTGQFVRTTPVTLGTIFHDDPKLFLTQMAGPPTIIAGIIGFLLKLAPSSLLRLPCRLVGWPTQDEFSNMVIGHAAWTEGMLSLCLLRDFGVDERVKVPIK
jgi:hypothetical protein